MSRESSRNTLLTPEERKFVEEVLLHASGVILTRAVGTALELCFSNAARSLGVTPRVFFQKLKQRQPEALACLVDFCVVGETFFFRHPEHFKMLPAAVAASQGAGKKINLWSAGCATGEEPYSLAMALDNLGVSPAQSRIVATDVSSAALARARKASYPSWSFRRIGLATRPEHFESESPHVVRREIRDRVEFVHHNLVTDSVAAGTYDVIFCRNVLIYFSTKTAMAVIDKLASALVPGGFLVLGFPEIPFARQSGLQVQRLDGATFLRKVEKGPGTPLPIPMPMGNKPRLHLPAFQAVARLRPSHLPSPVPVPVTLPEAPLSPRFNEALRLARTGELSLAEELASSVGKTEQLPVAFLLQSICATERGDLETAIQALERAIYLAPTSAMAHAELVSLYRRAGRTKDAERARRNALLALDGLQDEEPIEAIEPITAGALKRALEQLESH